MCQRRIGFLSIAVTAAVLSAAALLAAETAAPQESPAPRGSLSSKLRALRGSPMDLEVGGDLTGVERGARRYITRDDLLALPQVSYTVTDDSNFIGPTKVSGVLLEDLLRDLSAAPESGMVVAIGDDKYHANYPHGYIAAHHPLLVLEVNGKDPSGWPKDSKGNEYDMGPYMISQARFTPSFKIFAHEDEAQIPWGVVRLEFRHEKEVFGAIAARGSHANNAAVQSGYQIAQQNCFRCHNSGAEGGRKSGVAWTVLAALAAGSPEFFTAYVRDPAARNPKTQMDGSPGYDDATMRALIAYFATFAPAETR